MRRVLLAVLVLGALACRRDPIGTDLDRLEASLAPTPAQRPAWEAFRKEAEAADSPRAAWKLTLKEAAAGERFDAARAHSAADLARRDAGRLIEAWAALDARLSPAQRAAVRSRLTPE